MALRPDFGPWPPLTRLRDTLIGLNKIGMTPLDEWSARCTDHNLKTLTRKKHIHAPGGSRTHNPSKLAVADPRLRPPGHWDQLHRRLPYINKNSNIKTDTKRVQCEVRINSTETRTRITREIMWIWHRIKCGEFVSGYITYLILEKDSAAWSHLSAWFIGHRKMLQHIHGLILKDKKHHSILRSVPASLDRILIRQIYDETNHPV